MKKIVICAFFMGCALVASSTKVNAHGNDWGKHSHQHHKSYHGQIHKNHWNHHHKHSHISKRYKNIGCRNHTFGVSVGPHVTITANRPYYNRHHRCGPNRRPRVNVKVYPGHRGHYH